MSTPTVDGFTYRYSHRSTALRVRAISESAIFYQCLCFGSNPRKNGQAGVGWFLCDQIPNWTTPYSETDVRRIESLDCSDYRAARSYRDSQLVARR